MDKFSRLAIIRRPLTSSKYSALEKRFRRAERAKIANSIQERRQSFVKLYLKCVHKLKRLSLNSDEMPLTTTNKQVPKSFCKFDVKHWISVRYVSMKSPTPSILSIDSCLMETVSNFSVDSTYHSDYDYGMHICSHGEKRCLEENVNCFDDDFIIDMLSPRKKRRLR